MSNDPISLSATALLQAYRGKKLSPVEVTKAVLARIAALQPSLNAFLLVDEEAALAAARASEARWAKGAPQGLVDGVPTSVKDVMIARGWPTLRGSKSVRRDQPWDEDSPMVARLRDERHRGARGKQRTGDQSWTHGVGSAAGTVAADVDVITGQTGLASRPRRPCLLTECHRAKTYHELLRWLATRQRCRRR